MSNVEFNVDKELVVTIDEKGNGKISAADMKAAAKRADIDLDEVKSMQKRVNNFIGDVAATAGQVAVDHLADNPELSKVVTSFSVGETTPVLTVRQSGTVPAGPNAESSERRSVPGQTTLDMKKSLPTSFRKSIQSHVQGYAEPKLSAELKAKS